MPWGNVGPLHAVMAVLLAMVVLGSVVVARQARAQGTRTCSHLVSQSWEGSNDQLSVYQYTHRHHSRRHCHVYKEYRKARAGGGQSERLAFVGYSHRGCAH